MTDVFLPAVLPWVQQWLTPVWIMSLGVAAGFAALALAWGIIALTSRRWSAEIREALGDGVLMPIQVLGGLFIAFAVVGAYVADDPRGVALSLSRIPSAGTQRLSFTLPASPERAKDAFAPIPFEPLKVAFRRDEIRRIDFLADQNVEVRTVAPEAEQTKTGGVKLDITAGQAAVWLAPTEGLATVLPDRQVTAIYGRNLGDRDAALSVTIITTPAIPQVWTIPMSAIAVVLLFAAYLVPRLSAPKLSAIGLATFKSQTAQPVFLILSLLGVVALIALLIWPFSTLGEDIKAMKKSGILVILTAAMFQAIWAASTEIADEIEGRTALTVLSKPVGRISFITGKFFGIFWTVGLLFVLHGVLLMVLLAYKPIYEQKEGAADATWQLCHMEMLSVVPPLLLAFMQTIVLTSISVAISTRLPMLANLILCFSIYVLGNLTPLIVQSGIGRFEIVQFFGKLIATVFPNLENFGVEAAVSGGYSVPLAYLATSAIYGGIYTLIALLLALILFEDRDVA